MSAVERALEAALAKLQKRLSAVKVIIEAKPASRIIELRREAGQIMEKNWPDHETIAKLLKPLQEEEKRMFALVKKQKNIIKLIDEEVKLEMEIGELKNQLFWEMKKLA